MSSFFFFKESSSQYPLEKKSEESSNARDRILMKRERERESILISSSSRIAVLWLMLGSPSRLCSKRKAFNTRFESWSSGTWKMFNGRPSSTIIYSVQSKPWRRCMTSACMFLRSSFEDHGKRRKERHSTQMGCMFFKSKSICFSLQKSLKTPTQKAVAFFVLTGTEASTSCFSSSSDASSKRGFSSSPVL